jgi:eukaryotic-like serine/threonine-protein kinase
MTTEDEYRDLVPLGDEDGAALAGVHAGTGQAWALKVLPGRLDRRTRNAVEGELRRLAGAAAGVPIVAADRIVELADGRRALRRELCAQSLPELIAGFGPLSVADALALGSALAEALAAAHAAGVTHGGVTPGNVLFRASGEPVLTDFGPALRRAFPSGSAPGFRAPESIRDGVADERTDLYGLGAVLHLALAGKPPFPARSGEPDDDLVLRVLTEPPPALTRDDLPAGLGELVDALLAKEPTQRPADAGTVAVRLSTLATPPATADHPGPAEPGKAAERREPLDLAGPEVDLAGWQEPASTAGPVPVPAGQPILEFGPERAARRLSPPVLATLAAVALLAVVTVLLVASRPRDIDMPTAKLQASPAVSVAASPGRPAIQLELAEPSDLGNVVELTWASSEDLRYAVTVAPQGRPSYTTYVQGVTEYRLEVDPVLPYCFEIRGTNGQDVVTSASKSIRGAVCSQ